MNPPRTDIADLVENAEAWTITGDVVHAVSIDATGHERKELVSHTALIAYDPRLPAALRALQALAEPEDEGVIFGYRLRQTMDFWASPRFIDAADDTCYAVGYVFDMALFNDASGTRAKVGCWCYPYHQVNERRGDTTETITICYDADPHMIEVTQAWLDEHYPDWQNRWTVATTLGLTKDERAQYVLKASVDITAAALPDVSLTDGPHAI